MFGLDFLFGDIRLVEWWVLREQKMNSIPHCFFSKVLKIDLSWENINIGCTAARSFLLTWRIACKGGISLDRIINTFSPQSNLILLKQKETGNHDYLDRVDLFRVILSPLVCYRCSRHILVDSGMSGKWLQHHKNTHFKPLTLPVQFPHVFLNFWSLSSYWQCKK